MALKDLVADHRMIAEETIETIVAPYVRYDPAAHKIVWTPQAKALGNDTKVLVFLVAVLGWQYVLDESKDAATKPADLERELGIAGGTLRPILKKLKDAHLLAVVNGNYHAQLANLDSIEASIAGEMPKATSKGGARKPMRSRRDEPDGATPDLVGDGKKKKDRGGSGQLKTFLARWARDGFFNEPRTLANLLERYHEHGVITRQTSLSGLMLEAVREGLLARAKVDVGGKQVLGLPGADLLNSCASKSSQTSRATCMELLSFPSFRATRS